MIFNGTGPTGVRDEVLDWENEGGQGPGSMDPADCMVCGHSPGAHDKIARRFCEATIANALPRGCICRP